MEQQGTACFPAGLPESQSHSEHLTCPTRGCGGWGEGTQPGALRPVVAEQSHNLLLLARLAYVGGESFALNQTLN